MEILFLTGNLPYPPTDGWKIRVFSLIRTLARNHQVSVASFMRTTEDPSLIDGLRTYCREVRVIRKNPRYPLGKLFAGLLGPDPFPILNYRDGRMAELVKEMTRDGRYDIIQAESLHMAQYCLGTTHASVLDLHNIESVLMRRYAERERHPLKRAYAEVTWRKLAAYERATCRRFTHCLTCSEEDRRLLREQAGVEDVSIIPNGVDLDTNAPDNPDAAPDNRLVFVGRMDYHANVDAVQWFCRDILPLVWAKRSEILFQVVGAYPTRAIRNLADLGRIEITGYVEDVRPYVRGAAVVVVPLRVGGGTRLKILEAMAMGKPVLSTSTGMEGIEAVTGEDIIVEDHPRGFAAQILGLLDDAVLRRRIGKAGRRLVERIYGWDEIGRRLEQVYEGCFRPAGEAPLKLHRPSCLSEASQAGDGEKANRPNSDPIIT